MTVSYEEKRRQRMEENKKRMEELNLHQLAQSLKPIKRKNFQVKSVHTERSRQSARIVDKTPPNYKLNQKSANTSAEVQSEYTIKRKHRLCRVSIKEKDRIYTASKAKELASSLGSEFPTFYKHMSMGHVCRLYLGLPKTFCKNHLSDHNDVLTVIDEKNKEWQLNYRAKTCEFGGGWKKFCNGRRLVYGDGLVFQLIKPNTFRVYILRVNKVIIRL